MWVAIEHGRGEMAARKGAKIMASKAIWDLRLLCERTLPAGTSLLRFLSVSRLDPVRNVRERLVCGGLDVQFQPGSDALVIASRGVAAVVLQKVGCGARIWRKRERERYRCRAAEGGGALR